MSVHRKVYRFRLRPTVAQGQALMRLAGARRFVWNWALRSWKDHYAATGKSIPRKMLSDGLTALKRRADTAWLAEADSQALQQALKDLARAYANFFNPNTKARLPRFKSKKRDTARFRIPQRVKVDGEHVIIPKVGRVRIRQSMDLDLPTRGATFRRDPLGRWFVTLTAEFEMPDVDLPPVNPSKVVGIDLGLKDFAVLSDGTRIPAPKFFRKARRKLRKAQRVLSRRKPGSRRKAKARLVVAEVHQRTSNQRGDFLHKLTTDLIRSHDGLCIEDLSLKGMARTKLAKSVHDASLGEFRRQLTYKAEWNQKHLAVIDRWFPSSKMCRACKAINADLTLSDRRWACACGAIHDRDLNAAWNIKDEGLKLLAAGQARQVKRSGTGCQTSHGKQSRLNRESPVL